MSKGNKGILRQLKADRRAEAEARQAARDTRSPEEQMSLIRERRRGSAKKEMARLMQISTEEDKT